MNKMLSLPMPTYPLPYTWAGSQLALFMSLELRFERLTKAAVAFPAYMYSVAKLQKKICIFRHFLQIILWTHCFFFVWGFDISFLLYLFISFGIRPVAGHLVMSLCIDRKGNEKANHFQRKNKKKQKKQDLLWLQVLFCMGWWSVFAT